LKSDNWLTRLIHLIYQGPGSDLTPLSKVEYDHQLRHIDPDKAKRAFEKAWEIRNFEIELYWKRATYFWAFIASTFVGYFALVNAQAYTRRDPYDHAEVYFIICVGLILSLAWHLSNRGSKQWQRQWEIHVDLLEDDFTGPLYKTVHPQTTFSVSKINEIVSVAFAFVWVMLGVKYLIDQDLINLSLSINWFVLIATIATLLFASAMLFGYGRGRFSERAIRMYRRSITYETLATPAPSKLGNTVGDLGEACPKCGYRPP
jgi:hypothetical protein